MSFNGMLGELIASMLSKSKNEVFRRVDLFNPLMVVQTFLAD